MVFKRTILRGQTPPFVMELPSYKWPSPRTVLFRMTERGWVFLRCAGTLILAVSILVWAALYYPHDPQATHQQQQRDSYLGRAGRVIEPAVRPLGWDWRIGCAVLASLPAREIVVATMGVMYHLDDEPAHGSRAGQAPMGGQAAPRHLGRHRPAGVQYPRGPVDHGVFRAVRPMCGHVGGDPPRDEQLALAGIHLRLHDDVGLRRGAGDVSGGNVDRRLKRGEGRGIRD